MNWKSAESLVLLGFLLAGLCLSAAAQTPAEGRRNLFLCDQAGNPVHGCRWTAVSDHEIKRALFQAGIEESSQNPCLPQSTLTRIWADCLDKKDSSTSDSIQIPESFRGLVGAVDSDGRWAHVWVHEDSRGEKATLRFSRPLPLEIHPLLPDGPAPFQLYIRKWGELKPVWISDLQEAGPLELMIHDISPLGCQVQQLYWLGVRGPGFRQSEVAIRPTPDALSVELDLRQYAALEIPIVDVDGPERPLYALCQWPGLVPWEEQEGIYCSHPSSIFLGRDGNRFRGLGRADLSPLGSAGCTFFSAITSEPDSDRHEFRSFQGAIEFPSETWPVASTIFAIDEFSLQSQGLGRAIGRITLHLDLPESSWNLSPLIVLKKKDSKPEHWSSSQACCLSTSLLDRAYIVVQNERYQVVDSYYLAAASQRWREGSFRLNHLAESSSNLSILSLPETSDGAVTTIWTETRQLVPDTEVYKFVANAEREHLVVVQQGELLSRPYSLHSVGETEAQLEEPFHLDIEIQGLQFDKETRKDVACILEGSSLASLAVLGPGFGEKRLHFGTLETTPLLGRLRLTLPANSRLHLEGLLPGDLNLSLTWPGSAGALEMAHFGDLSQNPEAQIEVDWNRIEGYEKTFHNDSPDPCIVFLRPGAQDTELLQQLNSRLAKSLCRLELAPGEKRKIRTLAADCEQVVAGRWIQAIRLNNGAPDVKLRRPGKSLVIEDVWRNRLRHAAKMDLALLFSSPRDENPDRRWREFQGLDTWRQFEVFSTKPDFDDRNGVQAGDVLETRVCAFLSRREPSHWDRWGGHDFVELFRLPATAMTQEKLDRLLKLIESRLKSQSWSWALERESWESLKFN